MPKQQVAGASVQVSYSMSMSVHSVHRNRPSVSVAVPWAQSKKTTWHGWRWYHHHCSRLGNRWPYLPHLKHASGELVKVNARSPLSGQGSEGWFGHSLLISDFLVHIFLTFSCPHLKQAEELFLLEFWLRSIKSDWYCGEAWRSAPALSCWSSHHLKRPHMVPPWVICLNRTPERHDSSSYKGGQITTIKRTKRNREHDSYLKHLKYKWWSHRISSYA
jgi:hypothetical protein